jgi:hypothetical protein
MSEDERELTNAQLIVRRLLFWPYTASWWGRREVGTASVWLPADMEWPEDNQLPEWFWGHSAIDGRWAFRDCRDMAMWSLDAIKAGDGPAYAFDLEIENAEFREHNEMAWIVGQTRQAGQAEARQRYLPVLAIDMSEGWALTFYGIHWFDQDSDDPEDVAHDVQGRGP